MTKLSTSIFTPLFKIGASLFIVILFVCSCEKPLDKISHISKKGFVLPYDLDQFDSRNFLNHNLEEISALTISSNNINLMTLNDEEGKIFILEEKGRGIQDVLPFGKKGDYEGIENVNGDLYVLKNSGTLYLLDLEKKEVKKKYKTPLSSKNDVEGLGFNPRDSTLLLACKAQAGIGEHIEGIKSIYKFDLTKMKLDESPYLSISDKSIEKFLNKYKPERKDSDRESFYFKNLKKRASHFSPSAIAVHPESSNYYILSAVSKLLVVVNDKGKLLNMSFLDVGVFTQPEGICFSKEGTLYIANEAAKAKASICSFKPLDLSASSSPN